MDDFQSARINRQDLSQTKSFISLGIRKIRKDS